jgi:peptide deformylase
MNIEELELVKHNDVVLHQPTEPWNYLNPAFDLIPFTKLLVEKMRASGGIGLAANQVGIPYRIFCMETEPALVVINPKIMEVSDKLIPLDEGCLSYKGLSMKVKRPEWVKARFNYPNGEAQTYRFEGITARVFLHEFDHVEFGFSFFDRADRFHKEQGQRRWKQLLRKNK